MFGKKKKNKDQYDETEYEEVDDDEVDNNSVGDNDSDDDEAVMDALVPDDGDDDDEKTGIKARYSKLSRSFHKHMIYVRMVSLLSLTALLVGSLTLGIVSGLSTQGAKAKQVTAFGTSLQFSKTGAQMTTGQAYRSGTTLLLPLYGNGVDPIDMSKKGSVSGGTFNSATSALQLPSYSAGSDANSTNSSSFVPLNGKEYRMYVSALKGKLNPATQARYVKFGATGLGAIIVTNMNPNTTVRILLENKKVYSIPGASEPGLTVDGKVVSTKRDVLLVNVNLSMSKAAKRDFTIDSNGDTLLRATYGDDYQTILNSDQKVLKGLLVVDQKKLADLEANKTTLNASANNSSSDLDGSNSQTGANALTAQQQVVQNDQDAKSTLDQEQKDLDNYLKTVGAQMTYSSDYKLA